MTRPETVFLVLVLASNAPAPAAQQPTQLKNLGAAVGGFDLPQVDSGWAVFAVDEAAQGGVDLNGDGDATDDVLHVFDATTGVTTNAGVACALYFVGAGHAAFNVPEWAEGGIDVNGDGDLADQIFHVRDLATGTTTSLGISGYTAEWNGGLLLVEVLESDGGIDHNGDLDLDDRILFVYDPATSTLHDTKLPSRVKTSAVTQGRVAFPVWESEQGWDLNGDGDLGDYVLHTFELASGAVQNFGLSIGDVRVVGTHLVFPVYEYSQGGVDRNNDGDAFDHVLTYVDPLAPGSELDLGLAMRPEDFGAVGDHVWFCAPEAAQGNLDLNGDGDALDEVLFLYRIKSGLLTAFQLDAIPGAFAYEHLPRVDGSRIAFLVSELDQGSSDLNGDGDAWDTVLFVRDVNADATVNTGRCGYRPRWHGHRLVFGANEFEEDVDWNGDGDKSDLVQHVFDAATGSTVNLGVGAFASPGSDVCFLASEQMQDADWNGDGDQADQVPFAWDPATGAAVSLGVAAWSLGAIDEKGSATATATWDESLIAFLASEPAQGADLNGDGDAVDRVAMVVVPGWAHGLTTDTDLVSLSAGGTQTFRIDVAHPTGPRVYWVAGSASGTSPGLSVGAGVVLPLNPDAWLKLTLNKPNQGPLSDTYAPLGALGGATAALIVPPGTTTTLIGAELHHAFGVIDLATLAVEHVSNAVPLELLP